VWCIVLQRSLWVGIVTLWIAAAGSHSSSACLTETTGFCGMQLFHNYCHWQVHLSYGSDIAHYCCTDLSACFHSCHFVSENQPKPDHCFKAPNLVLKSCLGSANLCHDGIEGMAAVNIFLSWPQIRTARIVTIFIFQDEWFSLTSMEAWNPWWQHKQHWLLTLDLCALYWPIGQCFNLAF